MQPESKPHGFWYITGLVACIVAMFAVLDAFVIPILRAVLMR